MKINLKGELAAINTLGLKSDYTAFGRKYKMDWRTDKIYFLTNDNKKLI